MELVNPYSHVVRDLIIEPSCGCVLVDELSFQDLDIGQSVEVELELNFPKTVGLKEVLIHSRYTVKGQSIDELTQILLAAKATQS